MFSNRHVRLFTKFDFQSYFFCFLDTACFFIFIKIILEFYTKTLSYLFSSFRFFFSIVCLYVSDIGSVVFVFVSVYAPQTKFTENVKDQFYYALQSTIAKVLSSERLIISEDWNGHIGSHSTAFEDVHGGQALGKRNHEGERLLEFAVANELVVGNFWFKKKFESLVINQSGYCKTQIDYILYRKVLEKWSLM